MLKQKIETYYSLDQQKKLIEERLDKLNRHIKDEVVKQAQANLNETIQYYGAKGYVAEVQVKRRKPKIDNGTLEQLIYDKGLEKDCMRLQVDHDLVEQAFIEGKLTDSDLRGINGGSEITLSLKVDKIDV